MEPITVQFIDSLEKPIITREDHKDGGRCLDGGFTNAIELFTDMKIVESIFFTDRKLVVYEMVFEVSKYEMETVVEENLDYKRLLEIKITRDGEGK